MVKQYLYKYKYKYYLLLNIGIKNVGIFACVCGGAALQGSTSTDHVEWIACSFGGHDIQQFIQFMNTLI